MNKLVAYKDKYALQEEQYTFPYHYIPNLVEGVFSQHLYLPWGFRYICGINLIKKLLKKRDFNSLVDVGCGDGRLIYEIDKDFTGKQLLGVDISPQAISLAKALNPSLAFDCTNVCSVNSQNRKFDVAVSSEVLEHIPLDKVEDHVRGISGYLKPYGCLILTVPHKNRPIQTKHYQHFDLDTLKKYLCSEFNIEEVIYLEKTSPIFLRMCTTLLNNSFFTLNNKTLLSLFLKIYAKQFFVCDENNCGRLCIVAHKK